jgi:hypothetical protein
MMKRLQQNATENKFIKKKVDKFKTKVKKGKHFHE